MFKPPALLSILAGIVVPLASVSAQQPTRTLEPRYFLPSEYTVHAEVDVARLLDLPIFAALERVGGSLILAEFEKTYGFPFEELDRMQWASLEVYPEADDDSNPGPISTERSRAVVMQGSDKVRVGALPSDAFQPLPDALAGAGLSGRSQWGSIWLELAPGTLVSCDEESASKVLAGTVRGGVPAPRLAALTAGPRPLARLVGLMPPVHVMEVRRMDPIPYEWIDPRQPPHALGLQLEELESGRLLLSVRLSFDRDAAAGRDTCLGRVRAALEAGRDGGVPLPFKELLDLIDLRADRGDLLASVELPANGGPLLQGAQFAIMALGTAGPVPVAGPGEVEVIEVEKPAGEGPKKGGGGR